MRKSGGSIVTGFRFWLKGCAHFVKHPRLWPYVAIPLCLNLLITALFFVPFWDYVSELLPIVSYADADLSWKSFAFYGHHVKASFYWCLHGLFWILTAAVLMASWVIGFVVLASVIGSPFYDKLAYAIEKERGLPALDAPFSVRRDIVLPASYAVKTGVFNICCALLLFPISFIPLIGPVIYFCSFCILLSITLLAYSFERRFVSFRDQLKMAWQRRLDYLGLGAAAFLSMAPFGLAILTLPLSVCGAALLYADTLHADPLPKKLT